jgi:hypothetical protein
MWDHCKHLLDQIFNRKLIGHVNVEKVAIRLRMNDGTMKVCDPIIGHYDSEICQITDAHERFKTWKYACERTGIVPLSNDDHVNFDDVEQFDVIFTDEFVDA